MDTKMDLVRLKQLAGLLSESPSPATDAQLVAWLIPQIYNVNSVFHIIELLYGKGIDTDNYPEVKEAVEKLKEDVVKYLITSFKTAVKNSYKSDLSEINYLISLLRELSIDWPELDVIQHSVKREKINGTV